MYTEITINNAVVRVFLKILQDAVDKKDPLSLPIRAEARLQINNHHRSSPISNSPCSDDGKGESHFKINYQKFSVVTYYV